MSVDGIVAMSCVLLTNDVVKVAPSHVATELLLKLWPFTVRVKPVPPAVALLGEIEDTDGVDGQEEQETAGSNNIASALTRTSDLFILVSLAMGVPSNNLADGQSAGAWIREDIPRGSSFRSSAALPGLSVLSKLPQYTLARRPPSPYDGGGDTNSVALTTAVPV
jgi:hypothetical protein